MAIANDNASSAGGHDRASSASSSRQDGAGTSADEWPLDVSVEKEYDAVRIKGQGLTDEVYHSNELIRETIGRMSSMLDDQSGLELKAAETEADLTEALKLYRDMNHLSLAGGITCEQVMNHVQSHTVVLYYGPEDSPTSGPILVTAATFSMRNQSMMLRLLATHPRMTRKGFGRVTVHFLKEVCRALRKTDILVYTYPSSAPFYKALHFRHTNPGLAKPTPAAPATESAADAAAAREASRDARRVFSAKENEMICFIQPTMEQVLEDSLKAVSAHPYACTRRRAAQPIPQPSKGPAESSAPARSPAPAQRQTQPSTSRDKRPAPQLQQSQRSQPQRSRPPPRERIVAPPRERTSSAATFAPRAGPGGASANGMHAQRSSRRSAADRSAEGAEQQATGVRSGSRSEADASEVLRDDDGAQNEASDDTAPLDDDADAPGEEDDSDPSDGTGAEQAGQRKRRLEKNEYHVERIVGVRTNGGELQYLIKWKGWQSKYNTWEPLHHLKNLQSEIDAFEGSLKSAKFS